MIEHSNQHVVEAVVETLKDETPVVTTQQEDTQIIHMLQPFMDVNLYNPNQFDLNYPKRKKGPHEVTFWDSSSQGTYINPKRQAKKAKRK